MPLPVAREVHRRLAVKSKTGNALDLFAVRNAAVILAPSAFLSVAKEVCTRDVVMVANLRAAQPGEIAFRHVGASAVEAVGFLVVDPGNLIILMQIVPRSGFIGLELRAMGDAGLDEGRSVAFSLEDGRNRIAVALADDNDALALAVLVDRKAAVAAVLLEIGGLHIAAEITAIHFRCLAFAADHAVLELAGHCLAKLVQEHEGALVSQAQIAGDRQRGLALHFVAEDRDGREVHAERQLVRGEQRARGEREVLGASPAAEAERAVRPAALVSVNTAAVRANRSALRVSPAHFTEGFFRLAIGHAEDLSQAQRLCCLR